MKIFTDGSRYQLAQLPRIEEGFRALGHEIVNDPFAASLCYSNDGAHYDEIIRAKQTGELKAQVLFAVLDLAPANPRFDVEALADQLCIADGICVISEYVGQDLFKRTGLKSSLIYQPIKPVVRDKSFPVLGLRALCVGRVNDPGKRVAVGVAGLSLLGFKADEIVTAGPEVPSYGGSYCGVIEDGLLSRLYNSVDFLISPGWAEGLCLPVAEAMSAGVIPVVARDLTTRQELLPSSVFPEYDDVQAEPTSIAKFVSRYMQDNDAMAEMKERLHKHYTEQLAEKLSPLGVAKRIIEAYELSK